MELLADKIKKRLETDMDYSIDNLSTGELMTLWYEERNSDHQIADLFGIGISKVATTRKKKGVTMKTVTKVNEEKRMNIWHFKNEFSVKKTIKINEVKSLFRNEQWLLGVLNVFDENVKSIHRSETDKWLFSVKDNSFTYDYSLYRSDGHVLSFSVTFFEELERFRFVFKGKDYSKSTREIIWAFFQVIERKLKKIGYANITYSKLPESESQRSVDTDKLFSFKEDITMEMTTALMKMEDDFIEEYTNTRFYQFLHYLGEEKHLKELVDVFTITKLAEQHYKLEIKPLWVEGKSNRDHYLFYEKTQELLVHTNLCVFGEIKEKQ